jgi:hypothetical protein
MPERPSGAAVIAFVYSQPEARVLVCTLRAHGIAAFAFDSGTISAAPNWMLALGGIRIVIPAAQRDDAIELLYEIDLGWTCPPRPYAGQAWLSILLTVLLGFVFLVAPTPRARGLYAWRRRQSEPDSSPR